MERSLIEEQLAALRAYAEERLSALEAPRASLNAAHRALMLDGGAGGSLADAQAAFNEALSEWQAICDKIERLEAELHAAPDDQ